MHLFRYRFAPLLALLVLTLVLTYPTIATLTTHVVDLQDPLLNTWILAWEAHAVRVQAADFFTPPIFFPLANSLAFSEILLSTSLIVMPITWATDNAVLSYNLSFLFAFFSTALGVYLLAFYLTGHRGAAIMAAVAFAWSPYRMGHLSQLQLLTFGWLPLAFIYLDRLLRGKGNAPRNGLLLGFFFTLQALASFYSALFGGIAALLYGAGWLLWRRRLPKQSIGGLLVALVVVIIGVIPFTLPYFEVQRSFNAGWTLEDNERFSASLQAYGYAPEGTLFWDEITRPLAYTYGACCPPDSLFPGITLLSMSFLALWQARGGRRGLWLWIGVVAFVLSLGPTLTLIAGEPTNIALPYRWLYENLPLFDALRAPVRWAVLVTLALALLAALGVARLRWRWAWLVAFGVVLAEFVVLPIRVVPLPQAPASLAWLAAQPPTRVLELPLVAARPRPDVEGTTWQQPRRAWEASRLLETQYFSTFHWHETLDGYSGYVPTRHGDIAREVAGLPNERAFFFLRGLGFRYVVIHEDDLTPEAAARWQLPLPDGVREVQRFDDERVLELDPYTPPASFPWEAVPGGTSRDIDTTTLPSGSTLTVPFIIRVREPYFAGRTYQETLTVIWEGEGERSDETTITVAYPPFIERVAVVPITLTTPTKSGTYRLTIKDSTSSAFSSTTSMTIEHGAPTPPDYLPVRLAALERLDDQQIRLTWQNEQALLYDYSISVRVLDEAGNVLAQQDSAPDSDTPTSQWLAGDRYMADFTLTGLPTDEPLSLMVIWYAPTRNVGARVLDNGTLFVDSITRPLE